MISFTLSWGIPCFGASMIWLNCLYQFFLLPKFLQIFASLMLHFPALNCLCFTYFFLLYHAVQLKLENSWMICRHQTFIFFLMVLIFLDGPYQACRHLSTFFQESATSSWLIWLSLEKGWFEKEKENFWIDKCTHNMLKRATLFSHLFPTKKHIQPLPAHWA